MPRTASKQKPAEVILTPVGRLLSERLFEPEQHCHMEGRRKVKWTEYHAELAFDRNDLAGLESQLEEAAVSEWGAGAAKDLRAGKIVGPILDGKIRATTGDDKFGFVGGSAGVWVFRADMTQVIDAGHWLELVGATWQRVVGNARDEIYPGCYGHAAVTIEPYVNEGKRCLALRLAGFQKIRDGDLEMTR